MSEICQWNKLITISEWAKDINNIKRIIGIKNLKKNNKSELEKLKWSDRTQKSIKNGRKWFQVLRLNYKECDQIYTTDNALKERCKKEGESKTKKRKIKIQKWLVKVRQRRSNIHRSLWRRKPK